ncbi:MAG: DUF3047 domain-containing protein [Rhizobacter sp.]|nr:DUF3047 domain-containing protein [Rhizobacter sp.]
MSHPHRPFVSRRLGAAPAIATAALWAFAATGTLAADSALMPFGAVGGPPQAPWKVVGLPQQSKPFTRFSVVEVDGKRALKIEADLSYGNLVHPVKDVASPAQLSWQWRIEKPIETADLREKRGDDTAVKVCVFFDLPMDNVPFADRQLLRLARSKTSDPVPTATVCYVWDNKLPAGTTLDNAFTRRMRYIVLESGTDRLNKWVAEKRDVAADFLKLFGDESKTVPPIVGVAVGADADNTQGHSVAYVSGVTLD